PGGFHLAAVGSDVRGRSHVLTRNYRNTDQVYRLAATVVAGRPFDDGDAHLETDRGEVQLTRTGPPPTTVAAPDLDEHDLALAAAIQDVVSAGTGPGDLAVLVPTNAMVRHYTAQITGLGLPTQPLGDYDGVPNQLVKVGTYQRAKGLEFKRVFLPRLDSEGLKDTPRRGRRPVRRPPRPGAPATVRGDDPRPRRPVARLGRRAEHHPAADGDGDGGSDGDGTVGGGGLDVDVFSVRDRLVSDYREFTG